MDNDTAVKPLQISLIFKYSSWLLLVDQVVRLLVVFLYVFNCFGTWIFVAVQFALTVVVGVLDSNYSKKVIKKFQEKISEPYLSDSNVEVTLEIAPPDNLLITFVAMGFVFGFWFFFHVHGINKWYYYLLYGLESIGSAIWFVTIPFATYRAKTKLGIFDFHVYEIAKVKGIQSKTDVTKHHQTAIIGGTIQQEESVIELDSVDYNDTQIAKLDSDIRGLNSRVEYYVLESVLLGGLAFSGFLTVVASGMISNEAKSYRNFRDHFLLFSQKCIHSQVVQWFELIRQNFHREDLFVLVIFLCLMSSVFFLLVLSLRLRYSSLALNMDHLIRIMTIFNAKEEELTNLKYENRVFSEVQNIRLEKVTKKIEQAIKDASKLKQEIDPVFGLMTVYRNLAVIIFYLVLIVSGFYFSTFISTVILLIAIVTILFRWLETFIKLNRIRNLIRRH